MAFATQTYSELSELLASGIMPKLTFECRKNLFAGFAEKSAIVDLR